MIKVLRRPKKNGIATSCINILNQEEHHKKFSFRDEYLDLLKDFEIQFDAKYLFDWIAWKAAPPGLKCPNENPGYKQVTPTELNGALIFKKFDQ